MFTLKFLYVIFLSFIVQLTVGRPSYAAYIECFLFESVYKRRKNIYKLNDEGEGGKQNLYSLFYVDFYLRIILMEDALWFYAKRAKYHNINSVKFLKVFITMKMLCVSPYKFTAA